MFIVPKWCFFTYRQQQLQFINKSTIAFSGYSLACKCGIAPNNCAWVPELYYCHTAGEEIACSLYYLGSSCPIGRCEFDDSVREPYVIANIRPGSHFNFLPHLSHRSHSHVRTAPLSVLTHCTKPKHPNHVR